MVASRLFFTVWQLAAAASFELQQIIASDSSLDMI